MLASNRYTDIEYKYKFFPRLNDIGNGYGCLVQPKNPEEKVKRHWQFRALCLPLFPRLFLLLSMLHSDVCSNVPFRFKIYVDCIVDLQNTLPKNSIVSSHIYTSRQKLIQTACHRSCYCLWKGKHVWNTQLPKLSLIYISICGKLK